MLFPQGSRFSPKSSAQQDFTRLQIRLFIAFWQQITRANLTSARCRGFHAVPDESRALPLSMNLKTRTRILQSWFRVTLCPHFYPQRQPKPPVSRF